MRLCCLFLLFGCGAAQPVLNGCDDASYEDRSAASAMRQVAFGGVSGSGTFAYVPRCMIVAVGQSVEFSGSFSGHPLAPGLAGVDGGPSDNPIPKMGADATTTVTFPSAGTFPYFCEAHFGGGMKGAVRVK